MTTEAPHRQRMAMSRDHSARLEEDLRAHQGRPPEPGDLFVLRATADLPVEWALLERGAGGKLLAVPGDAGPPAGTADVEVPADAPGGPLSLRCRFSLWLDAALFEPELRSGVLAEESVAEALHRIHQIEQIESGALEGSPLAEEVDADPEYQDWSRDVSERARVLASEARAVKRPVLSSRSWSGAYRLAASLAILTVGLSLWVGLLLRKVDRLSEPISDPALREVMLGGGARGGSKLELPQGASHVILTLVLDSSVEAGTGHLEIVSRAGDLVFRSRTRDLAPESELTVILRRERLPDGEYKVRIYQGSDIEGHPQIEEKLRIETIQ